MLVKILPGVKQLATGYEVANSLRFNFNDDPRLARTLGTPTNADKYTFSAWIKRDQATTSAQDYAYLISFDIGGTLREHIRFSTGGANDQLSWYIRDSGSTATSLTTTRQFRDFSAWYHVCCAYDSTQSTSSNRQKIYINGTQVTSFSSSGYVSQNQDSPINTSGHAVKIGSLGNSAGTTGNFSGYMAEVCFIDGQALDPTSFGEFDTDSPNIWKPKSVSGLTFGNNGFHLDFEDSSALGNDVSGNNNDWTPSDFTTTDQTTDTCTNNFTTLNSNIGLTNRTNAQTYSEGNTISIPNSHDSYMTASSTIGLKGSGKWYWESQIVWNGTSSNVYYPRTIGFVSQDYGYSASYMGQGDESWCIIYQSSGGPGWRFGHDGSESNISGATSMANGDTMIFALDLDNGKFYAGRNGSWFTSGDPTSGSTGTGALATLSANDLSKFLFPACTNASNATYYKWNFGNPAYTISSGNSDANGYGNFEYSVPSGYFSINTKNLAEYG